LIVLADRSASIRASSDRQKQIVRSLAAKIPAHDRLGLVGFGRESAIESPAYERLNFSDFGTQPNENYTNFEDALRLGSSLLPADTAGHLLLLSDGRQNLGDGIAQARALRQNGIRLDAMAINVPSGPEVQLDSVKAPSTIPAGAAARIEVHIRSNIETQGGLRVFMDREPVHSSPIAIQKGDTQASVTLPAGAAGFHSIHAELDSRQDGISLNNSGEALLRVLGTQRVLIVEGTEGAGINLVRALKAASIEAEVLPPERAPSTVADWAKYQAVALTDVPAPSLGADRMQTLQSAVRDLGVGLSVFGGPNSLGPGGYATTPLEATLPIDMAISDRAKKPPIAVVLVLESMEDPRADAVMRGAARSVVDNLSQQDMVGITDSQTGFVVPLQKLTDKNKIKKAITSIPSFGDPPSYSPFLQAAAKALEKESAATKHIVIVGDGDAEDNYQPVISQISGKGITVSSIGVNVEGQAQFMETMHSIARIGKGRFYQSDDPSQVPNLLLQETQKGLKPWIVEEDFRPTLGAPSQIMAGLDLLSFPHLTGYVASTAKPAAEVVLQTPQQDPLVAQWQYGLGRAAAWTSDLGGRWTSAVLAWPSGGRLLANLVAWTLPPGDDPDLQLETSTAGDQGHLLVKAADTGPQPPVDSVIANIVSPDLKPVQIPLQSTGPGRYEADFPADRVGPYLINVTLSANGRHLRSATGGLAVAYSPEYRFLGTDLGFLKALAAAGGGKLLSKTSQVFRQQLPPSRVRTSMAFAFLTVAILLLPLDIAARRLVFRRGDGLAWSNSFKKDAPLPVPVEDTLVRLKNRLDRHRLAQGPKAEEDQGAEAAPADDAESGESQDLASRLLARRKNPD